MNDLMSFGSHRLWKRDLIQIMNIQDNDIIADIGSGTGDLVKLMMKQNPRGKIISLDLNYRMLELGFKSIKKINNIQFINCDAENLAIKTSSIDKYVISFCLRNVTNMQKALEEAKRVLKIGGSFYCLEFSMPETNTIKKIYSKYKSNIIPFIGEKIANNKEAYMYLQESIDLFPEQKKFLDILSNIGFSEVKYFTYLMELYQYTKDTKFNENSIYNFCINSHNKMR